ncbi:MAG TPA: hypothetical protein VFD43_11660, partial [Planctomycetota bacterium]|nr:hypothetical protein [Planctomycetota bacterium]
MGRRQLALVPVLAALAALAGPPARAQVAVVEVGDALPGIGLVFAIEDVAVDDGGSWMVRVNTDNPAIPRVVLVDGAVALADGQFLPDANTVLNGFADVDLEGQLGSLLGVGADIGAFVGDELVLREGDPCTAPELSPGTVYLGFSACRSGGAGLLALRGTVEDPALTGLSERMIAVLHVDGGGRVLSQSVALFEGMAVGSTTLSQVGTSPVGWDVNASGAVISTGRVSAPVNQQEAVVFGDTILAQEGTPSPIAGYDWLSLHAAVSVDDSGRTAFVGSLGGDGGSLLVRDGDKVVQTGDPLPLDDDLSFGGFGTGPIGLGNNGNLLYHGSWSGAPLNENTALFLNDRMAVREGTTAIGGSRVNELVSAPGGYDLSPDGEWLIFRASLDDGTVGAYLMEIGPWVSTGHGLAGTDGRTPALVGAGSLVPGSAGSLAL